MEEAGVDRINLFSRYPGEGLPRYAVTSADDVRDSIDHLAKVQAADPERIFGLIWANPRAPNMVEEVERGLADLGLRGVKLIPDHWSPGDELLFPLYEKLRELGKPIQFHAGILYGFGDSSRFCRPVLYEVLVNFPGLRFSLPTSAGRGWMSASRSTGASAPPRATGRRPVRCGSTPRAEPPTAGARRRCARRSPSAAWSA
jgi:predicted TIM-barrel fold metal-dependent hydrolase